MCRFLRRITTDAFTSWDISAESTFAGFCFLDLVLEGCLRRAGILSAGVGFVNFDPAAGPIDVAGKFETRRRGEVVEGGRRGGEIWIVGEKSGAGFCLVDAEDEDGVIDGELGEPEDVDDRSAAFLKLGNQVAGFGGEVALRKGTEHAPVAAVDVGLPGAAEILFEDLFMRGAELAQAFEARENNSIRFR